MCYFNPVCPTQQGSPHMSKRELWTQAECPSFSKYSEIFKYK